MLALERSEGEASAPSAGAARHRHSVILSPMRYVRTQIALTREQHRWLKAEAHRQGVSLAHLLRQLVHEALDPPRPRGDLSELIGLWDSGERGGSDVARHKDEYLAEAIGAHHAPR